MFKLTRWNKVIYITLIISIVSSVTFFELLLPEYFHYSILLAPFSVALYTVFMLNRLKGSLNKRPQAFVNAFLALTGLKLLLFFIIIILYFILMKPYSISFLALFFAMYLIFTIIEVKYALDIAK